MSYGELALRWRDTSEHEAFAMRVTALRPWAVSLAAKVTGDPDAAQDIVQAAFAKAWRRRDELRDSERLESWIRQIVVRTALNHVTRTRLTVDVPETLRARDGAETAVLVRQTLRQLEPTQQALLAMSVGEGWTIAEIATALGIPEGTASSRLHRAKMAFRALWEEQ